MNFFVLFFKECICQNAYFLPSLDSTPLPDCNWILIDPEENCINRISIPLFGAIYITKKPILEFPQFKPIPHIVSQGHGPLYCCRVT